MLRRIVSFSTFLIGVLCAVTAQAQIVSSFNTDLEGWTATGGALSYVSAGGNPGGFLQLADNQSDNMTVYAPAKFLGNLSAYQGSVLTFDGKNINNPSPDPFNGFGTVTITGAGGTASVILGGNGQPPPDGLWHTYAVPLSQANWSGNLAGALSNVTAISVILESNNSIVEVNGFDNFRIGNSTSAVPEPGSLCLLTGAAFFGGSLLLRRRRN